MNKLKLNLITEQVYITSQVNKIYENILKEESTPEDDSVFKKVLKDLGISSGFIFQFGTGIGAFMGPVTDLLNGDGLNMTNEQVALLIITSLAIMMTNTSVEVDKLTKAVNDGNLDLELSNVTKFILNIKKLMSIIGEKLGRTIYTLSDVLGFTFMLVPAMDVIKELINTYGTTFESITKLVVGVTMAAGSYTLKSVVDTILNKKGVKTK
jgi:hypothetical protein